MLSWAVLRIAACLGLRKDRLWRWDGEHCQGDAHAVVDANQCSEIDQTLCAEGLFGLAVETFVHTVFGAKLSCDAVGDLLVGAQVLGTSTVDKRQNGVLGQPGLLRDRRMGIKLVVGTPHGTDCEGDDLTNPLGK